VTACHPAFGVDESWDDFGISDEDVAEGSERSHGGPEVRPLQLVVATEVGTGEQVA
jgi:hypothetical protein